MSTRDGATPVPGTPDDAAPDDAVLDDDDAATTFSNQPTIGPVPSGSALRSLTRAARKGHGGGRWYTLVGDIYISGLTAVVGIAMAVQAARVLGADVTTADGAGIAQVVLDPGWLPLVTALAVGGLVTGLLIRLGPVGVGGAGALWWLPTPADRDSLLRPVAIGWVAGGAVTGAVLGAILAGFAHIGALGWFSLGGAGAGALLAGATMLTQRSSGARLAAAPRRARVIARVADSAFVLAVAGWALVAVLAVPAPVLPTKPMTLALLALGVVAAVLALRAVGRIPGAVLRSRGARTGSATAAIMTLDLRALGRILTDSAGDERRRISGLTSVRGAYSAVATADALLLLRSPWQLMSLLGGLGLPLALTVSGASLPMIGIGLVVGASLAANATAAGARAAQDAPALDRVLGLSAGDSRKARLPLSSAIAAVWAALVLGLLVALRGPDGALADPGLWLLALALGPGLAAAGQIAAYRKTPDWSKPLIITPQGAYPPGLGSALALGPMVTVVALLPAVVAIAVLIFAPGAGVVPIVVAVQVVITMILVAIASYPRRTTPAAPGATRFGQAPGAAR